MAVQGRYGLVAGRLAVDQWRHRRVPGICRASPYQFAIALPEAGDFRPRFADDPTGGGGGRQPRPDGSAPPLPGRERGTLRRLRRIAVWCYRKRYGDIRDRADALANDPLMIDAIGDADEARRVVYRAYAETGNPLADTVRGARQWDDP